MPRRMGRPGLMGTMARTAVIAGTATAVSGSMHAKQAQSAQAQQQNAAAQQQAAAAQQQAMVDQAAAQAAAQVAAQQAPAAPAATSTQDMVAQIKQLGELKDAGLLTEEEFAAQKAKLLNA
jgi:hypothetical protein